MGSRGHSDDMKAIFFGSTSERVLRFITRPVLCVPLEGGNHTQRDIRSHWIVSNPSFWNKRKDYPANEL